MMPDYVAGRNSVSEVLKSGRAVNKVFIARGNTEGSIRAIVGMIKERKIPLQEVDKQYLDKLTGERHQGIVAEVAPYEYVEIEDIIAIARDKGEEPLVVILADLEDPHNFGAILRTGEAAGIHGVIIPKRRGVQLNATVAKVSSGAAEYVPVARVANLVQAVEKLKELGLWVTGADMHGEKNLWQADLRGPLALIIGGEGRGIPKLLKEKCDFLTNIPMKGAISSLNASAAAAVLLFEVQRQRSKMEE
ncbi:23S rRNA (guanosine(2251)-2'-O)-methyltransferase RlmB [Dehalobacterium formicoaceticum]|uniref:23S rRNA (Guanosine(2251)-2'-O)-methyltransferase RlmB n=1 Tax=Dehalobacterium formicoaceticum TaxID=51515 RepID=A0ABT1XZ95_9FIRM|nr:23S rRNA (guanosine(2251)-2'-O)-methyltransferase RlmB [Dehalobacterium formicoaceticum]MCR6543934.1 23S rRNA (guanosine(2251)-2'-O)-methyltransferase RlmB [Dehalobacterium formicoaceticum]